MLPQLNFLILQQIEPQPAEIFGGKIFVTCSFTYQLKKVFGAFKMLLHSYVTVKSVHTTYCYNTIFRGAPWLW